MNRGQYSSHLTLKDTKQSCLTCLPEDKMTDLLPLTRGPPWTAKLSPRLLKLIEMNPTLKTACAALCRTGLLRAKGFYKQVREQRG